MSSSEDESLEQVIRPKVQGYLYEPMRTYNSEPDESASDTYSDGDLDSEEDDEIAATWYDFLFQW